MGNISTILKTPNKTKHFRSRNNVENCASYKIYTEEFLKMALPMVQNQ